MYLQANKYHSLTQPILQTLTPTLIVDNIGGDVTCIAATEDGDAGFIGCKTGEIFAILPSQPEGPRPTYRLAPPGAKGSAAAPAPTGKGK